MNFAPLVVAPFLLADPTILFLAARAPRDSEDQRGFHPLDPERVPVAHRGDRRKFSSSKLRR